MAEETIDQNGDRAGGAGGRKGNGCPEDGAVVREATKRLAQQGQWRTPPLPAFAASVCAGAGRPSSPAAAPATATDTLPTTPDEYARMLQEAYKRGAEAGARSQRPAAKQSNMPPPAGGVLLVPPAAVPFNYATGIAQQGATMAGPTKTQEIQVNNTIYSQPFIPTAMASNPPRPPQAAGPLGHTGLPAIGPTAVGPPPIGPPLVRTSPPAVSHSKSMPDMSSYQATTLTHHANDEEDKRRKRLARNRASARLRRLKKKNLVDSYEGEVGILESALSRLRSHRWGGTNGVVDHEALIEALSMERGQQPLTPEQRRDLIQMIVAQQREQVNSLLECQLENWILSTLVDDSPGSESDHDVDLAHVTSELQSILKLTAQQRSLIQKSSSGCVHEVQDLFTVDNCLQSMHANQWLLDEGVDEVAGQFTSILNPTQLSKFLLWSDHNADQIEKLDYVNVLSGTGAGLGGSGPVFEFGVDEGTADGD